MNACLDVHYLPHAACAAAIIFNDWADSKPLNQYTVFVQGHEAYEPGKFYLRELKPLLAVIKQIKEPIQAYLIDAYCDLSPDHEPGLGAHLYAAIDGRSAIIGVAKNRFKHSHHATEVFRGYSKRPLYVTSIGFSQEEAASHISAMSGEFRIPTLLKFVDQLARKSVAALR